VTPRNSKLASKLIRA